MEFQVLGPIEVYDDGGAPVGIGGRRPRAVLARLLAAQGTVVSADTLIDDLYGGAPPPSALATLQSYVSALRRAIEPERGPRARSRLLIGRSPGYLLAATNVDACRFTELVSRSEFRSSGAALATLDEALGLWRGTPYGEFADEPWATTEVNRLRELRLVAIERRAQALLDLGRPQTVITDLEAETVANPLRERLWCLLALALYRTGRQAEALAVLRRVGELLADQLGLDPGPELRALENDILQQVDSLAPVKAVTPPTAAPSVTAPRWTPRGRDCTQRGRDGQLAELVALSDRAARAGLAVAAVSGEPGIGKTCLLEAFQSHCSTAPGHVVLWGGCHDAEGTPPLWPWIQVLEALERHCPPPDRAALAGLLDGERTSGSTDAALLRRSQAIARWLVTAARTHSLVVILDDLQWADSASLKLLKDVVTLTGGSLKDGALTVVVAFRDTPPSTRLDDLLGRLARYDLLRLRLTGLTADAVRAIAADLGVEIDAPTSRQLAESTGGNPFCVRECVKLLAQGLPLDTVPEAVSELIRLRLEKLEDVDQILRIAAVIGREFDPAVVAEVA
ncbi:BTAD domain-containing putative transcriptional regulator, partial [Streptosporangium fragile]|uniref:BTAD domain-containing putative transcriptional regulator n=1 Tax=Streptosporangium fragile TaxID=46186 RepID=UPI0031ECFD87